MSAKEQMRAMIEQLMGSSADEALKSDFEKASETQDYGYDIVALETLGEFIRQTDERAKMARLKLKETQDDLNEEAANSIAQIHELSERIGSTLSQAEKLDASSEGCIDESIALMSVVEALRKEKTRKEYEFRSSLPASVFQQQKLRVCEVCSAYLGIHDNDRRLADHFGGKLHLGFIKIREQYEELKKKVGERKEVTVRKRSRSVERHSKRRYTRRKERKT